MPAARGGDERAYSMTRTTDARPGDRSLGPLGAMRISTPRRQLPPGLAPVSAGLLVLALMGSTTVLSVAAVAVLILGGVLLWRPRESPILLFVFAFQWLQVVTAIFYAGWLGIDLDDYSTFHGDMQMAATLSLAGLTLLACGLRLGAGPALPREAELARLTASRFSTKDWFWLYLVAWTVAAVAQAFAFVVPGLSQPLIATSGLRWAFFLILTYAAFSSGIGIRTYWLTAFALELAMSLGSYFSDFKNVFIFTIFGLVAGQVRFRPRDYLGLAGLAACMLIMGIVWSDVKMEYRKTGGGIGRLVELVSQVDGAAMSHGLELLIQRIGYIEYFAAVINYVPHFVPYTNGEIWADAIVRPFTPRLLFPQKSSIDDSSRTNMYTGLTVSGAEAGTSISIGYMAETYIDFGPVWMMPVIAAFGYFLGLIHRHLLGSRGSRGVLGMGLASAVLFQAAIFEQSITKALGGILVALLVAFVLIRFVIPKLVPWVRAPAPATR